MRSHARTCWVESSAAAFAAASSDVKNSSMLPTCAGSGTVASVASVMIASVPSLPVSSRARSISSPA
jgi:hypothetical protein